MSLKFIEQSQITTMKNDAKFEEELTCRFKIDMKNFTNFNWSTPEKLYFVELISHVKFEEKILTWKMQVEFGKFHHIFQKPQIWDFDAIFLSKVENL